MDDPKDEEERPTVFTIREELTQPEVRLTPTSPSQENGNGGPRLRMVTPSVKDELIARELQSQHARQVYHKTRTDRLEESIQGRIAELQAHVDRKFDRIEAMTKALGARISIWNATPFLSLIFAALLGSIFTVALAALAFHYLVH